MRGLFLTMLSIWITAYSLLALDVQGGHAYTLAAGDSVTDDLLYFGRSLEVNGWVKSDVYFFGETIQVNGQIGDDLLIFSRRARILGEVRGNVFFFGQELQVEGTVHGSIRSMGERIQLLPGAVVHGSVFSGSKAFVLDGARVDGDVQGGADNIILNGIVNGNIRFEINEVTFGEQFKSSRSVEITFYREKPASIPNAPPNLIVHVKPTKPFYRHPVKIWLGLSGLLIGLLFISIFPGVNREMAQIAWQHPLKVGGVGGLFLIIMPVVTLLSVIVLPLMFILGGIYLMVLYLSKLLGASILGQWLMQQFLKQENPGKYLAFLVGFFILKAVTWIPYLGTLAYLALAFLGTGALLRVAWRQYRGTEEGIGMNG
ncbi:MAG: polymer-forming cytoskeletal protein [Calditrichaeota bacterium]|nr:polymer-forming cytoskeletal protein [Calditrichota bacterium]